MCHGLGISGLGISDHLKYKFITTKFQQIMNDVFKEATGLPQFIVILFFVQLIFFGALYYKVGDLVLLIVFLVVFLIGVLMVFSKLKIDISKERIRYSYFPLTIKVKEISWVEVDEFEIIKVSALSDFLGWGIKYSKKYGWGYITNAKYGIRIKKKMEIRLFFQLTIKKV